MKFDKLLESLLLEMPHVHLNDNSSVNPHYIDLEIERYSDNEEGYEELLYNVNRLLNGQEVSTKIEERKPAVYNIPSEFQNDFLYYLKNDAILRVLLKNKFRSYFKDFIEGFMEEEKPLKVIEKFLKDLTYIKANNSDKQTKL